MCLFYFYCLNLPKCRLDARTSLFYMCPYGRFQSVMFDKDTLIVSYDTERGESRGARKNS